jgi:uncharacterized low-complexity protein
MKKTGLAAALAAGLLIGAVAASHAKLPPSPAKSDAEKTAEAEKAAAAKAKEAELNSKYQDKAVANYRKNKGIADPKPSPASKSGKK